jgi:hypothetical protein
MTCGTRREPWEAPPQSHRDRHWGALVSSRLMASMGDGDDMASTVLETISAPRNTNDPIAWQSS